MTSKRHTIRDADGKPRLLVSVVEDVTERKRLERERDRDREFLNQIIDNVPTRSRSKMHDQRYVLIESGRVNISACPATRSSARRARRSFRRRRRRDRQHDEQLLQSGGSVFDEYPLRRVAWACEPSRREARHSRQRREPQYLLAVIEDVTERKLSEERIAHLAHYDALTDLPNRVSSREQLEQALKRSGAASSSRCSISTSTNSRASTTRSATRAATSCSRPWRSGCAAACAKPTSWRGLAATSLRSCRPRSTIRPMSRIW